MLGTLAAGVVVAAVWLLFVLKPQNAALEATRPTAILDYWVYYLPNAALGFSRLREGSIPFWDACRGLGGPFLATAQTGLLYPPNWIHLLLPVQQSFAVLAALHLALGACFASLFARSLGASGVGIPLAGIAFGLSPYLCAAVWTPPVLYSAAWVPAVLLAVGEGIRRPSGAAIAGLGCALGLQALAGWPFVLLLTAALAAVFGIAAVLERTLATRSLPVGGVLVVALGGVIGAALAAPQLLPTLELASHGPRAPGLLTSAQAVFLPEPHLPITMGRALLSRGVSDGIPGLGALFLAVLAALLPGPARIRIAALLLAALLSLLVSFGDNTPVYGWLRRLPLFSDFRFPMRYRLLSTLAIAVCAGVGASRLVDLAHRRSKRMATLAGVSCAALLGAQCIAVVAAQLPYAWRRSDPPADIALTTLERVIAQQSQPSRAVLDRYSSRVPGERCVPLVNDLEPLSVGTTASAMLFFENGTTASPGAPYYGYVRLPEDGVRASVLDVLAVPLVASTTAPEWLEGSAEVKARFLGKPFVFRRPTALPRAYRVSRFEPQPETDEAALARLVADDFDPETTVLLQPAKTGPRAAGAEAGNVVIERYEPERVVLRTRGGEPGFVVLVDAFFPGWTATVDGGAVPILRANLVGRAVEVPAGERVIEMTYRPTWWTASCFASVVAGAGISIAWVAAIRNGRRRRAGCPRG